LSVIALLLENRSTHRKKLTAWPFRHGGLVTAPRHSPVSKSKNDNFVTSHIIEPGIRSEAQTPWLLKPSNFSIARAETRITVLRATAKGVGARGL
jgi:hypothetical protein